MAEWPTETDEIPNEIEEHVLNLLDAFLDRMRRVADDLKRDGAWNEDHRLFAYTMYGGEVAGIMLTIGWLGVSTDEFVERGKEALKELREIFEPYRGGSHWFATSEDE